MTMQLGMLGEVTAYLDGCATELGPARQRCVLAALAVDAGRVVPVDRLLERVWGADTPRRGRATLHSHISRLRQALPAADVEIVLRSGGYVLLIDHADQAVDLLRFRDLRARARAAGRPPGALWAGRGRCDPPHPDRSRVRGRRPCGGAGAGLPGRRRR